MKKIILTLIASAFCLSINAQVQLLEWELQSAGVVFPTKDAQGLGVIAGTEVRLNLCDGKISPGLEVSASFYNREYDVYNDFGDIIERRTGIFTINLTIQGVCDYNFKPLSKVSPFAGIGVGLIAYGYRDVPDGVTIMPSLRVGCEFYKFLRATLDFRMMKYGLNYFALRLGFVIGGRNKATIL